MNQKLIENNYIVVPNFISSSKAKELSKQFKEYCEDYQVSDDPQVSNCETKYDFIPFVELLVEKTQTVSQLVGESVLPTYSYARIYKEGNELPGHVDKPQCEISLTVNLDCTEIWNIWIESPNGKRHDVSLCPGDAMLYLGMSGKHGRDVFEGESCSQVFLHYVRAQGPFFKYYFDKDHKYKDEQPKSRPVNNNVQSAVSESPLVKYIKVYENVFTAEECKRILDEYANCDQWTPAAVGSNGRENNNVRNCDIISTSLPQIVNKNMHVRQDIDQMIFKNANSAAKKYVDEFPACFLKSDSGYDLLRYNTGGFYREHTDSFKEQPRTLAMSVNLNDDYEGGNIAFFGGEVQIRGGIGSVIMFPANFMYPHQIMDVTKGTRYSIVTWFI